MKARISESQLAADRLVRAIETSDDPPEDLLERIRVHKQQMYRDQAQLEELALEFRLPTENELLSRIDELIERIRPMRPDAKPLLQKLLKTVKAVPHQQFGGDKVVLIAQLTLHVWQVFPAWVQSRIDNGDEVFGTVSMSVELFNRSTGPAHGLRGSRSRTKV